MYMFYKAKSISGAFTLDARVTSQATR